MALPSYGQIRPGDYSPLVNGRVPQAGQVVVRNINADRAARAALPAPAGFSISQLALPAAALLALWALMRSGGSVRAPSRRRRRRQRSRR